MRYYAIMQHPQLCNEPGCARNGESWCLNDCSKVDGPEEPWCARTQSVLSLYTQIKVANRQFKAMANKWLRTARSPRPSRIVTFDTSDLLTVTDSAQVRYEELEAKAVASMTNAEEARREASS